MNSRNTNKQKKRRKKTYSSRQKADFYAEIALNGRQIKAAAEKLKINYQTARYWAKHTPEVVQKKIDERLASTVEDLAAKKVEDIVRSWAELECDGVNMAKSLMNDCESSKEAAQIAAIAREKLQLITGHATTRNENTNVGINLNENMGHIEDTETLIECAKMFLIREGALKSEEELRDPEGYAKLKELEAIHGKSVTAINLYNEWNHKRNALKEADDILAGKGID